MAGRVSQSAAKAYRCTNNYYCPLEQTIPECLVNVTIYKNVFFLSPANSARNNDGVVRPSLTFCLSGTITL